MKIAMLQAWVAVLQLPGNPRLLEQPLWRAGDPACIGASLHP